MDRNRESDENSMGATSRSVGEAAASAAERVSQSIDEGRAALADVQTLVTEKTRECMRATDVYVRDNPWQAIGIAAGLGLVLGLLMARR